MYNKETLLRLSGVSFKKEETTVHLKMFTNYYLQHSGTVTVLSSLLHSPVMSNNRTLKKNSIACMCKKNIYVNMNVCEIKHQNTLLYYTCKRTTSMRSLQQVKRPEHVAIFVSLRGGDADPSCNSRSVVKCDIR